MRRIVKKPAERLKESEIKKLTSLVYEAYERDQGKRDAMIRRRNRISAEPNRKQLENDIIDINFESAYVRSMAPTLYFQDPVIKTLPKNPNGTASAQTWGNLINTLIQMTDYSAVMRKQVDDALYYGEGWKKRGWVSEDPEDSYSGGGPVAEQDPEGPLTAEQGRDGTDLFDNIASPRCFRISPLNIATDCQKRTLEDSRFVAVRYEKRLNELVADPVYNRVTKRDADRLQEYYTNKPSRIRTIDDPLTPDAHKFGNTPDDPIVVLWEIWVYQLVEFRLYKQVVVVVEGMEGKLARDLFSWSDALSENVTGYPFSRLTLMDTPDRGADHVLRAWEGTSRAINTAVSRMVNATRRMGQRYLVDTRRVHKPNEVINELRSGIPISIFEVKDSEQGGNPPVMGVPNSPIESDLYNVTQILNSYLTQISGYSANQRGAAGVRTATEANRIEQHLQIRTDALVNRVSDCIRDDAIQMIQMLRGVVSPGYVFRILNDVGNVSFGEFTEYDVAYSPDVTVVRGSFRAAEKQDQLSKYQQLLGMGMQLYQIYGDAIRLDILFSELIKGMEIANPSDIVQNAANDERVQQLHEIILMLTTGQPVPTNNTDDHATHYQVIEDVISAMSAAPLTPELGAGLNALQMHAGMHAEALQELEARTSNLKAPTPQEASLGNTLQEPREGGESVSAGGNF